MDDAHPCLIHERVLVLNRLWQVVNVCTVRRAFGLLCAGRAQVVWEENGSFNTFGFDQWKDFSLSNPDDDALRTVSFRVRVPRIILLMVFDRLPRREVRFTRANVFQRDQFMCQYCGRRPDRRDLTLDHVVPRDRGGRTVWTNVVTCCRPCNSRKGNRLPEETGMRLRSEPKRPRWRPFVQVSIRRSTERSWRRFLDPSSWSVELGDASEVAPVCAPALA